MTDPLLQVKNPLQYLNREVNSVHRDFESSDARIALAFPDMYELGMSHLGLKILYEVVNGHDRYLAERVFAPAVDREEHLRKTAQPLSTLESGRPLSHFDVVGFTLPYELTYTNIINMIDLAHIPIMAEERTVEHPLICGGGPGAHNPEPLADFFDFFLLGDGEEAIIDIAQTISEARAGGEKRDDTLRRLAGIGGVYVPRYYQPSRDGNGRLLSVAASLPGLPAWINRRFLSNLDDAPFPISPPVPYLETTHDRVTIEIARGCIQRCRFCQAGPTYRPYRERSPGLVLDMAEKALRNTGYDEISLSALSCGDHSNLHALLSEFMNRYVDKKISVSLPSLRPGTLSEGILREIKKVKRTGFTIAPEAGSQRLRDVVSKGVTEEDIFETSSRLFREGWNRLKLYFMVGLPTETAEDHRGIVRLSEEIRRIGKKILGQRPHISTSVSCFVPKPHTPFQWSPQIPPAQLAPVLGSLKEELRRKRITFKWHKPELSTLEGAISRGGREMGKVILGAWKRGRRFDGWTEHFEYSPWLEAFEEAGIDPEGFIGRSREIEECLPWDHLCSPDLKGHLVQEFRRAEEALPTAPCSPDECPACGVCDEVPPLPEVKPLPAAQPPAAHPQATSEKLRIEFSKFDTMRYLPHLSLFRTFYRAFRRADIPLAFSQGHTPHPRIQFGPPLPLGYEGEAEYLDVEISGRVEVDSLIGRLSAVLPKGLDVRQAVRIPHKSRSLFDIVNLQTYRVILPKSSLPSQDTQWLLSKVLDAAELPLMRTRKGKTRRLDLRPLVDRIEIIGETEDELELFISLHRLESLSTRPSEVLTVAGGFSPEKEFSWRITRTANLIADGKKNHLPTNLPNRLNRKKQTTSAK